jgi:hypothetical protein
MALTYTIIVQPKRPLQNGVRTPRICSRTFLIVKNIFSIGLSSFLCVFRESAVHPSLVYRPANRRLEQPQLFCLECHCVPKDNCYPDGISPGGSPTEVRRDRTLCIAYHLLTSSCQVCPWSTRPQHPTTRIRISLLTSRLLDRGPHPLSIQRIPIWRPAYLDSPGSTGDRLLLIQLM